MAAIPELNFPLLWFQKNHSNRDLLFKKGCIGVDYIKLHVTILFCILVGAVRQLIATVGENFPY